MIKKISFLLLSSLVSIGFLSSCSKSNNENTFVVHPNKKSEKLDSLFQQIHKEEQFNGNVLIAMNDTIILSQNYGYSDLDKASKLTTRSTFRLASITKQFTAIAILILQKENQLSIQDPISKHIPELSNYSEITIENLISHTSGVYDYADLAKEYWDKNRVMTNKSVIELFEQHQPKSYFKPNEDWAYSNTGYIFLATIVERVTGQKFEKYIHEKVLKPFDLKHTFFYESSKHESYPFMTNSYVHIDSLNRLMNVKELSKNHRYNYLDNTYGAGGLASNIVDLYHWHQVLNGDELLSAKDKNLMYKNHLLNDGSYSSYGYGTFIVESRVTGKRSSHGGDWAGYDNMFDRHIENNTLIVLLQNVKSPNSFMPMNSIYQILYNSEDRVSQNLEEFAGRYSIDKTPDDIKEFLIKNDKLVLNVNDTYFLELVPIGQDNFLVKDFNPEVTVQFLRNKEGMVSKQVVYQYGKEHHATKLH